MILGSYADLKIIKTRSVVQIVVEVPLERGKEVTDLFGLPQPNAEIPVLVSRIDPEAIQRGEPPLVEPQQIEHHNDDAKPPRPLSQVAAILCGIGSFQQYICETSDGWDHRPTTEEAAAWLRSVCDVKSRTEINTNPTAQRRFKELRSGYDAWLRVPV